MTDAWDYYGEWDLSPEYASTIGTVVQSAIAQESAQVDALIYTVAMLWFVNGGIRSYQRRAWRDAALPVLEDAHLASAQRGAGFSRLIHALNTRSDLNPDISGIDLASDPAFTDLLRRTNRFIDAPVTYARWRVGTTEEAPAAAPESTPLRRAVDDATVTGFLPPAREDTSNYRDAMQRGAARVVEQAVSDGRAAYDIGLQAGAVMPGTMVERWLKVPHSGACEWCFLVAARGFRTAGTVARHKPIDKCGARAVWVAANNRRKGETVVGNQDWYDALIEAGYGGLIGAGRLSREEQVAVARSFILRSSDFQSAIDSGTI